MQELKTPSTPFRNLHIATRLSQIAQFIRQRLGTPDLALVAGSGLRHLKDQLAESKELEYKDIPFMPQTTVYSHGKKLIMGKIKDKKVLCWTGRVHGYEGYSPFQVSFIGYISAFLNAKAIIITNAAGGNNKAFQVGSLMLIKDYIHWSVGCPEQTTLRDSIMGRRNFSNEPVINPYLKQVAIQSANQIDQNLEMGNYCYTSGPTFETFIDTDVIRKFEGYSLGMSTVPQIFGARQFKLNVIAFSLITNMGAGLSEEQLAEEEIFLAAETAGPKVQKFIRKLIQDIELDKLSFPVLPESSSLSVKVPQNVYDVSQIIYEYAIHQYEISYITEEQLVSDILPYLQSKFIQLKNNSVKNAFVVSNCQVNSLEGSIALSSVPHFRRYNKMSQDVLLNVMKINNQHEALVMYNVQEGMFQAIEAANIAMILKGLKIQNVATVVTGFSFVPSSSLSHQNVVRIKDFCDRQYNMKSRSCRKLVQREQVNQGALLVGIEGPMYPTPLERKGYAEILKFDYFTVANLSLIQELEGDSQFNSSIWVAPSVDSNTFKARQILKEDFVHIFDSSLAKNQLKKVNQEQKKNQPKTQSHTILIPRENNIQMIENAAIELKKKLTVKDGKQNLFVTNSERFGLFKEFEVVESVSLKYESEKQQEEYLISPQIYKLKNNDDEFYVLITDRLDVAGVLTSNGQTIPIKIACLTGFTLFTFISSFFTPIQKFKGKILLMKDRVMWNMKKSLLGQNISKWGPHFFDIADSNSAINNKQFEEIWKKEAGNPLQKVNVIWSSLKKPYFGSADNQLINVLGCQGYVEQPLNDIEVVTHMKGTSLVILCGGGYGEQIEPVHAKTLIQSLLQFDKYAKV